MGFEEDHIAYAEPQVRPILGAIRNRIKELGWDVKENVTSKQRFTYSVERIFAEVKVQKKCVLVRFFLVPVPDQRKLVKDIPKAHGWQHELELRVESMELVDYAMPFIGASYASPRSRL